MEFEVGDKIRGINSDIEGCEGVLVMVDEKLDIKLTKIGDKSWQRKNEWQVGKVLNRGWVWERAIEKIGGTMSKYAELKSRIKSVTAWDKEADDILQNFQEHNYYILISTRQPSSYSCVKVYQVDCKDKGEVAKFQFESQCEKLQAFKDALMYLLDHSDIKKTIVGTEQKIKIDQT